MPDEFLRPDDLDLWRFSIISPLLHCVDDGEVLREQIKKLSQRVFYTPDGKEKQICAATIRYWLSCYRSSGLDGLRSKKRKDRGTTEVPLSLQQALFQMRKDRPEWTIIRLLRTLRDQEQWNGLKPSRSALYRFTVANELNRKADAQNTSAVRSFEFPYFGDLWSADFLHGPKVCCGANAYKTYLHAIIDDATRYVVAARFHFAEDTRALLDDLTLAIRRFGIPKRLYTDNGAAFRSRHLRMIAAKLGMALPHTPPYTPRGRGKIERFFRSVRDGFLTGRERTTLDKINRDLAAWINRYHHTEHATLKMSPLNRKDIDNGPVLKQIASTQDIDELFRMEHIARVASDGCVRMFKKRFEVPNTLPGTAVTIYYLPWDQERIFIEPNMTQLKPLDTTKNALRFEKPRRGLSNPSNTSGKQL